MASGFDGFSDDAPLPSDRTAINELRYGRAFDKEIAFNGETRTIRDWAQKLSYSPHTLKQRLERMDLAEAMSQNIGLAAAGRRGAQRSQWRTDSVASNKPKAAAGE